MAAEKVRAAFQRAKVRDLYDLWVFSSKPMKAELLRALVVLKLWQVKDAFDPEQFFKKIDSGKYDWDDLKRLLRSTEKLEAATVKADIKKRYAVLARLTEREKAVVAGARTGKAKREAEALRDEARRLFTT